MGKQNVRRLALLAGAAFCALTAGLAAGQAYPTKPIRLIAPFPPGGSSDTLARILGQKLTEAWGQRIVVKSSLPVKSIKDLIALAKSKPGALNFGSSGSGTLPQLGGVT